MKIYIIKIKQQKIHVIYVAKQLIVMHFDFI